MKKNVFEEQETMEERNCQIIYLYHILKWTPKKIGQLVGLANTTISGYVRKFKDLLSKAIELFEGKVVEIKQEIKTKAKNLSNRYVTFECEHKVGDCAYIIEYYDSNKEFVFLKVGMTNNIERRISEHLRDYYRKGFDTTYAVVKRLFFGEDEEDALTLENCLRKHYKRIENSGFIKRDRFSNVRYDREELQADIDTMTKINMFAIA